MDQDRMLRNAECF